MQLGGPRGSRGAAPGIFCNIVSLNALKLHFGPTEIHAFHGVKGNVLTCFFRGPCKLQGFNPNQTGGWGCSTALIKYVRHLRHFQLVNTELTFLTFKKRFIGENFFFFEKLLIF